MESTRKTYMYVGDRTACIGIALRGLFLAIFETKCFREHLMISVIAVDVVDNRPQKKNFHFTLNQVSLEKGLFNSSEDFEHSTGVERT